LKNDRAYQLYAQLGFRKVAQTDTHNHMASEPSPCTSKSEPLHD
jgi:hypothetical protein